MNELNKKNEYSKEEDILRIFIITCICIVIVVAVFSKDIMNYIKSVFEQNTSNDINIIEQNLDNQKLNGTEVKIDNILMDDFNLDIMFNIKLQDFEVIEEIKNFEIPDLIITDENDNIIVAKFENENKYKEFCEGKGLEITYKNIAYSDGSESSLITNQENPNYSYSFSTHSQEFPKSKKLKAKFNKIIVKGSENNNVIEGNWNIEAEIDEEMYNRESVIYKVKNCNDENTILTKAVLSKTALKIELTTTTDKIDYEALNSYNGESIYKMIAIQKEYLENTRGERFETAKSYDGDGGYHLSSNNIISYYQTFNITSSDATDELKLILPTNDNKEIIIELER